MNVGIHKRGYRSNSFCFGMYNILEGKACLPFWREGKANMTQINI